MPFQFTILAKRGPKIRIPSSAGEGEFVFCNDTHELYIGQGVNLPLIRLGVVDDSVVDQLHTWSSEKIQQELSGLIKDTNSPSTSTTWSSSFINNMFVSINNTLSNLSSLVNGLSTALTSYYYGFKPVNTVTEDTLLDSTFNIVLCDGDITLTLPLASNAINKTYTIKNIGGSANIVTQSSDTIDGDLSFILPNLYASVGLASNGVNWYIV